MEDLIPWFFVKTVPGIGNHLFRRLLDRFETPAGILGAGEADLYGVEGMTPRLVGALRRHKMPAAVHEDLALVQKNGYRIISFRDAVYPCLLRHIADPPPLLYLYGSLDPDSRNIAVVGSRNATHYGIAATLRLCRDLASHGLTVVSGMARGIDTAAHEGALSGRGATVAVLGCGLGTIYPAQNERLFHRIAERGAVISEFPFKAKPDPHHFPVRNRIISGMCAGTVVVEATRNSGSLITAHLAAEQGREVFAVPGSVASFKSMGTHRLIKEGARLVENARDILEELSGFWPGSCFPEPAEDPGPDPKQDLGLSQSQAALYGALGPYPVHIDTLCRELAMEPGAVAGHLLQLELKGLVRQTPGKFFMRGDDES